jgi:hypothetical protein
MDFWKGSQLRLWHGDTILRLVRLLGLVGLDMTRKKERMKKVEATNMLQSSTVKVLRVLMLSRLAGVPP